MIEPSPKILPLRKFPITHATVFVDEGYPDPSKTQFPHPRVIVEFDTDGNLLQVSVIGADLRVGTETNDPLDISLVDGNPPLDREKYIADYEANKT